MSHIFVALISLRNYHSDTHQHDLTRCKLNIRLPGNFDIFIYN